MNLLDNNSSSTSESEEKDEIQQLLSEISNLKTAMSKLQKTNQLLQKSNDELRSDNGLKLRSEQQKLEASLQEAIGDKADTVKEYEKTISIMTLRHKAEMDQATKNYTELLNKPNEDRAAAERDLDTAKAHKKEYEDLRANQIAYIKKKAIEITEIERNAIREQYKALKVSLKNDYQISYTLKEGFHIFALVFCIIFLFIQAAGSPIIVGNFKSVCGSIIGACENNWERLITWTTNIYDAVHKSITNETAGLITGVIIAAIIASVFFALFFLAIPVLISFVVFRYIKSGLFGKSMGWIMIVSGMLCIVLPQWILMDYSWNYLIIWLSIQVVTPIIRYIVIPVILAIIENCDNMSYEEKERLKLNLKYYMIIAFSIILGIILIKFFIFDAIREAASPKPLHHMP